MVGWGLSVDALSSLISYPLGPTHPTPPHREPPRWARRTYNFRPSGLPRRPVGPLAQKVAGPHGDRAKTPSPAALYRSVPLTWSVPRADLGLRISVFSATQPGFLAPCPEFPFRGCSLKGQGANTPLTLILEEMRMGLDGVPKRERKLHARRCENPRL